MDNKLMAMIGLLDGRSFTIGREGNIRIDSPTASKIHASIKISGREIYLRDLNSTNGTYLIVNNIPQLFEEGFVGPHQVIVIGGDGCAQFVDLGANGTGYRNCSNKHLHYARIQ